MSFLVAWRANPPSTDIGESTALVHVAELKKELRLELRGGAPNL